MAVPFGSAFGTTASAATFLQGDANGDGAISLVDAMYVIRYITGMYNADGLTLARMDCDGDYAITMSDHEIIMNATANIVMVQTVTRNELTASVNDEIEYYKYTISSRAIDEYTLEALPYFPQVNTRAVEDHEVDTENINVVELDYSTGDATGFIVDSHVIATAAHTVLYRDSITNENKFEPYVNVTVRKANGVTYEMSTTAVEIHVPKSIKDSGTDVDYDYALIYVEDDLSEYGIWNLGIATNEFMNTGEILTTTGVAKINGIKRRYYSTGAVVQPTSNRAVKILARGFQGKSGGPIYYNTTYGGEDLKTVVAITRGGTYQTDSNGNIMNDSYGNPIFVDTLGVRMTPALLQFYLYNDYIG